MVTKINNALITAGYTKEATTVGGELLTPQFQHPVPLWCIRNVHSDPDSCGVSGVNALVGLGSIHYTWAVGIPIGYNRNEQRPFTC